MVSPQAAQGERPRRPRRYGILLSSLPERCTSAPDTIHHFHMSYICRHMLSSYQDMNCWLSLKRDLGTWLTKWTLIFNNLNLKIMLQYQWNLQSW